MTGRALARFKDWTSETRSSMRPYIADPWASGIVAIAFAVGIFVIAWNARSLRLDVDPAALGWICFVAFGTAWHGEWGSGWRIAGGLFVGSVGAVAGYYGSLGHLPVTPFAVGLALGVTGGAVAVVCHAFSRMFSFAGAAVGFGVGIAGAREFGLRPTTPADDLFSVILTICLALAIGVFGSMGLRAFVVGAGMRRVAGKPVPPRPQRDGSPRSASVPKATATAASNGSRAKTAVKRPARPARPARAAR